MKASKEFFLCALATIVALGTFGLLVYLSKYPTPVDNKELLYIGFGAIMGSYTTVIGYFFGSSRGSADKQELLIKANNEKATPAAPTAP